MCYLCSGHHTVSNSVGAPPVRPVRALLFQEAKQARLSVAQRPPLFHGPHRQPEVAAGNAQSVAAQLEQHSVGRGEGYGEARGGGGGEESGREGGRGERGGQVELEGRVDLQPPPTELNESVTCTTYSIIA